MFFWYVLSIYWAPNITYAGKYIFYIFCGIAIAIAVIHFATTLFKMDALFQIMRIIFLIEIMVALLESFTAFRWPISPYSPWLTFFGKEPVSIGTLDNLFVFSDFFPPTGFHWNTNNLAITMVMILPFFLCSHKIMAKILGSIAITSIVILAASRAVFLGLVIILCFYLLIIKKKVATLSLIWFSVFSLFWGMSQLKESENPRINEVANSLTALTLYLKGDIDVGGSLAWRSELVDNGIAALVESKGLGVGAGGSVAIQEKIGGVAGRFTSMHNFWIEVLVESGVIFFSLMVIWYGGIIINLFKISKLSNDNQVTYYASALLLTMIGFIPAAIAASSTIYFFPMWIMFGMAIAIISIYRKAENIGHNSNQ